MRKLIVMPITVLLAGCSMADDPDNIPVKGVWEIDYRVSSIRAGNMFMTGNDLPAEFQKLALSDRRCTEPRFADKDAFFADFASHMEEQCEMTDYETTDTTMRASGYCSNLRDLDYEPSLKVKGDIGPENFKMVLTFDGPAEIPGAGRRALTMIAVAEAKRVGDC